MLVHARCVAAALGLATMLSVHAQRAPIALVDKQAGDAELAQFQVESAPGTVSAAGLIGVDGVQLTPIEASRDFTMLLRLLDGGMAAGFAFTPARSSILPLNVSTYYEKPLARVWGGTTFALAQGTASISDKRYRQQTWSVESAFYLQPAKDDPLFAYWHGIVQAAAKPDDASNPCLLMTATLPDSPAQPVPTAGGPPPAGGATPKEAPKEDAAKQTERANACRTKAESGLRWNASRAWVSLAGGNYRPESGGSNRSMGRTAVLGMSYGIGDAGARSAGQIVLAARRTWDEPTLETYDADSPTRQRRSLVTLRGAYGKPNLRALLEASHQRDGTPSASDRVFKRAIGIEFNFREGMWLSLRAGKQRRIDGSGDETGSSFSLSINPEAVIKL